MKKIPALTTEIAAGVPVTFLPITGKQAALNSQRLYYAALSLDELDFFLAVVDSEDETLGDFDDFKWRRFDFIDSSSPAEHCCVAVEESYLKEKLITQVDYDYTATQLPAPVRSWVTHMEQVHKRTTMPRKQIREESESEYDEEFLPLAEEKDEEYMPPSAKRARVATSARNKSQFFSVVTPVVTSDHACLQQISASLQELEQEGRKLAVRLGLAGY